MGIVRKETILGLGEEDLASLLLRSKNVDYDERGGALWYII